MFTRTVLAYLKAAAAILTTIVASGAITGHWLTDSELLLSGLNGVVVALTPNVGMRIKSVPPSVPPKQV